MKHLLHGVALAALVTTGAHAASAQEVPSAADPAPSAGQPVQLALANEVPAAAPADDSSGDIVVTALRRETNLQDTPVAISVLTPEAMEDRHVQSLVDMVDGSIPSLRVATFESRQSALTVGIRGIVPFDANQTARDQGVGVYIDGVYLGRQQGLDAALFDVQRIEVLRGPQGTLFGRNTEGGALNIVTRQPTGQFGVRASAGFGNFGSYQAGIHIDLPAFANIAIKLDGIIQHQDATTENPLAGQAGWNFFDRVGGRVQVRWTPFEGFTADLSYDQARNENTPFYSQLANYNPLGRTVGVYDPTTNRLVAPGSPPGAPTCTTCIAPLSPLVVVNGEGRMSVADIGVPQQPSVDRTDGFMVNLRYHASQALELRSITAWRGVNTEQWDNSGGGHRTIFAPNTNFSRYSLSNLRQSQFSQEFQLVGSVPQFDYVLGLYYYTERVREFAATPSTNRWNVNGTGYTLNSPIVIPPITSGNQGSDPSSWYVQRDSNAEAHSYAAYGQVTWTPAGADFLHLTLGGRYTQDKRDGVLTRVQNRATNFPFTFSDSRFDPMATIAADVTPDINLYARFATGYRAGGANSRSQTFTAFGPESVTSYEVGAKFEFLNRRVRLDLAAYLMDRTGTQTDFDNVDTNPTSPTFNLHTEETRNAPGTSHIRGFEADLTLRVTDNLTFTAAYAYTYTRVPPTANPFLPGNPLFPVFVVFTPPNAASAALDYNFPIGDDGMAISVHLDAAYADPQYSFQAEPVKTDSSFIVNGSIALVDIQVGNEASLTISAWSRNLFNEAHIYRRSAANAAVLGDYANFNAPRTFGIEARVRF
jgi:iron complex outermembrane recepter protein